MISTHGYWDVSITRFHRDGSYDVLEGGPRMDDIDAFSMSGIDDIWFAGIIKDAFSSNRNVVVHYAAGEWEILASPAVVEAVDLHCFGPNDVWLITAPNNVHRYNGSTWVDMGSGPTSFEFRGVEYRSPQDIWAAGAEDPYKYCLFRYEGVHWREVYDPGDNNQIRDIAMVDGRTGWAVGHRWKSYERFGQIWECRNGEWLPRVCPVESSVSAVGLASGTEAWAIAGNNLLVYRTGTDVKPASLGRIKSLYADGRGGDAAASPSTASSLSGGGSSAATYAGPAPGAGRILKLDKTVQEN